MEKPLTRSRESDSQLKRRRAMIEIEINVRVNKSSSVKIYYILYNKLEDQLDKCNVCINEVNAGTYKFQLYW